MPSEHWTQDPRFWDALDNLTVHSGLQFKELLDVLWEYKEQLSPMTLGLLFGGVGEFFNTYSRSRRETNSPIQSFELGVKNAQNHPLMQSYMQQSMNQMIDAKVGGMKNE
tara:strand:+ start:1512 stop:1841 length:330 start_codon:yes stop_codon:yes gene_type:complete